MRIEAIRLKNFKAFQQLELSELPNFCALLGKNGSGKSTFFDVFGFLRDALKDDVHRACQKRGGYQEIISRDVNKQEGIEIEVKFRMGVGDDKTRLVTYFLHILEDDGRAVVAREYLAYKRGSYGSPYRFLDFQKGAGDAITNEALATDKEVDKLDREKQKLISPSTLALKGLGQFERFKAASQLQSLIESWHISDFQIAAARQIQDVGLEEHLSATGDNLPQVTQYMNQYHPQAFERIRQTLGERVPGIGHVEAKETEDGRILLKFRDEKFREPFTSRYVSDGTIKMFAYLVLLNDPKPHPLLCVEEPENQLYPNLLPELVEEFRAYAQQEGDRQIFVSTHSPDFLDACEPQEVFLLDKKDGRTTMKPIGDDRQICALIAAGDRLGALWRQNILGGD